MTSKEYQSYKNRVRSFFNWQGPRPDKLAKAGFFSRKGNTTECFSCGVQINSWEPLDDPLNKHLQVSEHCKYAKLLTSIANVKSHFETAGMSREVASYKGIVIEEKDDVIPSKTFENRLLVELIFRIIEYILLDNYNVN